MQEQVELSGKRVKDLTDQLKNKKEALEKFTKSSKEHRENRRHEIENLKKDYEKIKSEVVVQTNPDTTNTTHIIKNLPLSNHICLVKLSS
jgi:predicted  nucleic acid-binding Zn-ribbon protein